MKKFALVLLMTLVAVSFVAANDLANDLAIGFWKSIDDDGVTETGYWELYLEGKTLSGKMIYAIGEPVDMLLTECAGKTYKPYPLKGVDLGTLPLIDTLLMWDMSFKKAGLWEKGRIIDPESGSMYYVRVTAQGDKLVMKGSIDKLGVLGRSQTWVRTTKEEAYAALEAAKAGN